MNKYLVRTFIALGATAFLLIISAGLFWLYARYAPDSPAQEYPDLKPQYTALPNSSTNGLELLHGITEALTADEAYQNWSNAHVSDALVTPSLDLEKSLTTYQSHILDALKHPMQCAYSVNIENSHEMVMSLLSISQFLRQDLERHIQSNSQLDALDSMRASLLLASKSSMLEGNLIVAMVQIALTNSALENTLDYLEVFSVPVVYQEELASLLRSAPSLREQLCNACNFEFTTFRKITTQMAQNAPPFLQQNKTIHSFAIHFRELKKHLQSDLKHHNSSQFTIYDKFNGMNRLRILLSDNSIGNGLISMMMIGMSPDTFKSHVEQVELTKSTTQTLLALNSHHQKYGSLPPKLIDLVPEYLKSLPVDPFSSSPLLYSKDKKLIWSIGNDYKNNLGVSECSDRNQANNLDCLDEPHLTISF